jgi:hypothetical protein
MSNVLGNKKSNEPIQLAVIVPRRLGNDYISVQQVVNVPVR